MLAALVLSLALPRDAAAKIAPRVLADTEAGRAAEFLVVLSEAPDLHAARALGTKAERGRFVRDTLLARSASSQRGVLAELRRLGVPHRAFFLVDAVWVKGTRETALHLAARPDVLRVEANPSVRGIEPDALAARATAPLSPAGVEPGVAAVGAPEVWALGFTGQGIVVAGADTGIAWEHPALKPHYRGWDGAAAHHDRNWHDSIHSGGGVCGADATAPCDDHGHGTHTIGTAVGDDGAGNQIGVAPGAAFIGCRNMDQGNGTPATYVECMEWFLAPYPLSGTPADGDPSKAPDVVNNSWSCPASEGCSAGTLKDAVEALRAAGIMFVAAAGNGGPSCSTIADPPAIYDASYSVGAYATATGSIASFSSRGPVTADGSGRLKPDAAAPGVNVRSALPGGGYGSLSGTSMASPHAAGCVALLWSAAPGLRNEITRTESFLNLAAAGVNVSLCGSSGVPNDVWGFGRLDVKAATDRASACAGKPHGDANGDGTLDVADVFALINFLFAGAPKPACPADVNGDGATSVADVLYLVNHLFAGGPPPL